MSFCSDVSLLRFIMSSLCIMCVNGGPVVIPRDPLMTEEMMNVCSVLIVLREKVYEDFDL